MEIIQGRSRLPPGTEKGELYDFCFRLTVKKAKIIYKFMVVFDTD